MKNFIFLCCCAFAVSLAQAQIIHIPDDYPSIQQGINAANPGDTILVSNGHYYEQINFLGKKPLMVASEFIIDGDTSHISNTIIDGSQIQDGDTASVVLFISGEDTTSVLCGFTITRGLGTLDYLPTRVGGGIYARNSGLKLQNNIINGNSVDDGNLPESQGANGGGVFIDNEINSWSIIENNEISYNSVYSSNIQCGGGGIGAIGNARITNNIIQGNSCTQKSSDPGYYNYAGGIYYGSYGNPMTELVLQNNIIENNALDGINGVGAGAKLDVGKITCTGNEFLDNSIIGPQPQPNGGGGLAIYSLDEGSTVSGNIFIGNESVSGGGAIGIWSTYNWLIIENNYFFNNSARLGGAVYTYHGTLILQNNVFYKNHASLSGGAVFLDGNDVAPLHTACVINNSFSENSASTGGAITTNFVNPIILNSVFWQDSASIGPEIRGGCLFIEIAYSDIDTNLIFNPNNDIIIGDGIINENPWFSDTLLNLSVLSPCIDMGIAEVTCHNHTWKAPVYDIMGVPRPQSGGIELGAYEMMFEGIPSVVSPQSSVISYPNPLSDFSTIEYVLEKPGKVTLTIYNQLGEQVGLLVNEYQERGKQQVKWNAEGLPGGVYFCQLSTINNRQLAMGKLVLVK